MSIYQEYVVFIPNSIGDVSFPRSPFHAWLTQTSFIEWFILSFYRSHKKDTTGYNENISFSCTKWSIVRCVTFARSPILSWLTASSSPGTTCTISSKKRRRGFTAIGWSLIVGLTTLRKACSIYLLPCFERDHDVKCIIMSDVCNIVMKNEWICVTELGVSVASAQSSLIKENERWATLKSVTRGVHA